MKRSTIWILTIVMALALLGAIAMQLVYLEQMAAMRNSQFSEGVLRSLYSVSQQLEQNETKYYLDQDLAEAEGTSATESFQEENDSLPIISQTTAGMPDLSASLQQRQQILKGQYLYQRSLLNEVVLQILNQSGDRPIKERADSATVSYLLTSQLAQHGIDLAYEFAVTGRDGTMAYHSQGWHSHEGSTQRDEYSQVLFANDGSSQHYRLRVTFPAKNQYIFSSIKFVIPCLAMTLLLLGVFVYTISLAWKQKRLSEIKNDFINNMTHEFKTPISSISIAAQMLNDDSVRKSPTMLNHVATVINDETKRLRFQVEKVLQLSLFDRKSGTMRLEEEDAHANIESVINTFKLRVEKYGGTLTAQLLAEDPIVKVDKMHFTNVIFNLLDNAIKYRREDVSPQLIVTTRNPNDHELEIAIQDNGIGMKREDVKRVFEKFYRVSTGNRHDVKGFGLGLAYVQKMIRLFGGDISLESELGKGSKFTIKLPLYG